MTNQENMKSSRHAKNEFITTSAHPAQHMPNGSRRKHPVTANVPRPATVHAMPSRAVTAKSIHAAPAHASMYFADAVIAAASVLYPPDTESTAAVLSLPGTKFALPVLYPVDIRFPSSVLSPVGTKFTPPTLSLPGTKFALPVLCPPDTTTPAG